MEDLKSIAAFFFLVVACIGVCGQSAEVFGPDGFVTIEEGSGGFFADLDPGDRFSRDHDVAGDINGDGVLDLVVGARSDDDGAVDAGAVYILFMNNDGTVQSNQKISMLDGGFSEVLNEGNFFGYGVAGIGDYDEDDIPDIAVSAPVPPNNALYIIHLNANGTVKDFTKTSGIHAQGLSAIGDVNGDGRIDLVACDPGSDTGGTDTGAIRILFFNENSVLMPQNTVVIDAVSGGFGAALNPGDEFGGREAAMLGDLDGDGTLELAVGAFMSDGGKGAIWILSLNADTFFVEERVKITEGVNGFNETLTTGVNPNGSEGANFGHALAAAGDLNGDGVPDLMTGANQQYEGWGYILYLNADKSVKTFTRMNNEEGGFNLTLGAKERFSRSISFIGDLRGDGTIAVNYGGGAGESGTLYLMFFKPCSFSSLSENLGFTGGMSLFSNWDEINNQLLGDFLSQEQCFVKAFENNAPFVNFNNDGKCICLNADAQIEAVASSDLNFVNECEENALVVNEISNLSFTVYPSHASSLVNFRFQRDALSRATLSIYDLSGRKVLQEPILGSSLQIDVSDFSKGMYISVLKMNGRQEALKFVVE